MLERDPTTFPTQHRFGKSDNPAGERGNCFQTCLACILALPLEEVPHFYDTDEEHDQQYQNVLVWLAQRGWVCVWTPWEWIGPAWTVLPSDSLLVVSGKSPRGDWGHVVVGRVVTKDEWQLVHDPHPDRTGLDGRPYGCYLLAPLPTLLKDEACHTRVNANC